MALKLLSRAFGQGGRIPKRYTCEGDNVSPPLYWTGAPEATQGFLLVCDDPDAPGDIFHHWAAFDIPAHWSRLAEGYHATSLADGFLQAVNDFGKPGYAGPCPPRGHSPHHYHFRLSALSEARLPVATSADCVEVMTVARPYVLEFTELVGLFSR